MENALPTTLCTAFAGTRMIASGELGEVALKVKAFLERQRSGASPVIFDDVTSAPIEVDLRGSAGEIRKRLEARAQPEPTRTGPGRPKLGVVSREVGLLPSHWDWLALQPGGASSTLRKLVEEAKKKNRARDEIRRAQEAVQRFLTAIAGDLPLYEEALRAFYKGDARNFGALIASWPEDVRTHATKLAEPALR